MPIQQGQPRPAPPLKIKRLNHNTQQMNTIQQGSRFNLEILLWLNRPSSRIKWHPWWQIQTKQKQHTHMTVLSSTKMSQLWAGQEIVWKEEGENTGEWLTALEICLSKNVVCAGKYLAHSFLYDFGGQVISPALHAKLVSTLQASEVLWKGQ